MAEQDEQETEALFSLRKTSLSTAMVARPVSSKMASQVKSAVAWKFCIVLPDRSLTNGQVFDSFWHINRPLEPTVSFEIDGVRDGAQKIFSKFLCFCENINCREHFSGSYNLLLALKCSEADRNL